MDKNAIKKYAVWARNELIARVTQKAQQYGITAEEIIDSNADSINGKILSDIEKKQRQALIKKINTEGFDQVMEEVAYTWFNRFTALRFMEVNGYLPSHTRIFSNEANEFKPQIMDEAISIELDNINRDLVFELKNANKDEELFKYLIVVQCNALSEVLPRMFQHISDYSELLIPDYLLREGSVIYELINWIPEEDWKEQVQIIGWLYQSYIAEPKDTLINARGRYKKEDIPYVTQLFTSDWIVRHMVDNTLGRAWINSHPDSAIKNKLAYYLDNHSDVEIKTISNIEEIKCIDPCSGSGHILCYLFDVLMLIYEECGYGAREAVELIVRNNIWGIDIDERAAQMAYFSVMMKARQYDRRFLSRGIQPNIFAIPECGKISKETLHSIFKNNSEAELGVTEFVKNMADAKEIGSILKIKEYNWELFKKQLVEVYDLKGQYSFELYEQMELANRLEQLFSIGEALTSKYDIVVTNPPYMNSSYMPPVLKDYVQTNYADYKSDMFAVFINRAIEMCKQNGHVGMLTPYVWMFIASYEKLRNWLLDNVNITSLVQLEYNAFEAACVPVASFTFCKTRTIVPGEYVKLSDFRGAENQGPKTLEAISNPECGYRYSTKQSQFKKLPGCLIAYWASERVVDSFGKESVGDVLVTREGMATADNEAFLRLWTEVDISKLGLFFESSEAAEKSGKKWFPYNKGGDYRKWYGNNDYVVNWENDGALIRANKDPKTGRIRSHNYNGIYAFKKGITWSALSSSNISVRYTENGFLFDSKGAKGFSESEEDLLYSLAVINSKVGLTYLSFISPTIDFKVGDVIQIPLIKESVTKITELVKECISISQSEWDSYETSWNFKRHPLANGHSIKVAYDEWCQVCNQRILKLISLEEEINKELIKIYGLEGEVDFHVERDEIALRDANFEREIKSLISYVVGCLFGRYSVNVEGLCIAGKNNYPITGRNVDKDNIIPICDDDYFDDDMLNSFISIIEEIYGKEMLEENLKCIASALRGEGSSREVIRNYFLNEFYDNHCADYAVTGSGKRPIYWLFDSGKKNGFKCLIYMHRYMPDTIARIRTDYVHELQSRYKTAIESIEQSISEAVGSERIRLSKQLKKLQEQDKEILAYEEKIHHLADQMISIDLDDGVKENYAKFQDVLAKIK